MGEFARGIHIYKKDKTQIMQMLPDVLQGSNYIPCERDDADRAIAIIESDNWVSVFDSDIYEDAFNKALSLQTDAHCVSIDLMDGDCLRAILWKNGRRVNTYISDPEYIGIKHAKSNRGNARKWGAITQDTDALQDVFDNGDKYATNRLFEMSKVLAISDQLTLMQYDYLEQFPDLDASYLYFRDTTPKPPMPEKPVFKWDGSSGPNPLNREIEFEFQGEDMPTSIFYTGEKFTLLNQFVNIGPTAKGLTIAFTGPSLENESVAFERVQLFDGIAYDAAIESSKLVAEADFEKVNFQDGRKGYYARFDEAEIDTRMGLDDYSKALMTNKSKAKLYCPFSIKVFGEVLDITDAPEAYLFVHPNENYFDGHFQIEIFNDYVDFRQNS
ncbi:MAG: hypothetical protein FWB91_10225 [Defluviitaleaceae bacterium]|nr:hypothetical protein [Defluviitaleaceae bacterium]